jgi:hypothetical protein
LLVAVVFLAGLAFFTAAVVLFVFVFGVAIFLICTCYLCSI